MANEPKWTPGTWEARCFLVLGGTRMTDRICHVGTSTSLPPSRSRESEANARLIAAAPDMYEALRKSAEGWENAIEMGIIAPQHITSATVLRDEARAALAKARGES